ncbi:MAG: SDR family NAD(P)-dependent oxidoreductase [Burkholderiales bacterium]|nr:SDR family NAD(P)-dependent oxidoreductase [Burkholderiales bacterium]
MPTALIIGASRGIGHEFVRQYRADGWRVVATCRKPADLDGIKALGAEPHLLDVTDNDAVVALSKALAHDAFDTLVINAGIFPEGDADPAHLDELAFLDGMRTNVLGPMRVAGLFGPLMAPNGTVGVLSSKMGSVSLMAGSNALFYRTSKAAVNMVVKSYANAWRERSVRAIALHPGWVQTDMGGSNADIDVATSVRGLRAVLAAGGMERSGGYFDYAGNALPW